MEPALAQAHARLVALLACALEGAGVTPADEFARLLRVYAEVVGEDDPEQSEILIHWADAVIAMLPLTPRH